MSERDDALQIDSPDRDDVGARDVTELDEVEEAYAARRVSAIEAGRRKGGIAGAAMAGAMLAIQEIYEGPHRDDFVAVSESPDEPGDIDKDGIEVTVGDVDVWAPPPGSSSSLDTDE